MKTKLEELEVGDRIYASYAFSMEPAVVVSKQQGRVYAKLCSSSVFVSPTVFAVDGRRDWFYVEHKESLWEKIKSWC